MNRLVLLLVFAVTMARAEQGVRLELHVDPANVATGLGGELRLSVTVGKDWHLYGRTGGGSGQAALKIKAEQPAGIEFVGDWVWPKPETSYEGREIEVYTGAHLFTRKFRVLSKTAGDHKIRVTVSYQACTHEVCGPPEEETLTATLKVTASTPKPEGRKEP